MIDGDITLRDLEAMTSLNGLGSLVSTNGELLLHNMPRLTSTRALTNFTSVGECHCVYRHFWTSSRPAQLGSDMVQTIAFLF